MGHDDNNKLLHGWQHPIRLTFRDSAASFIPRSIASLARLEAEGGAIENVMPRF